MAHPEALKDIPDNRVDKIVAMYKADECTGIKKEKQPDGKWTVKATCPD